MKPSAPGTNSQSAGSIVTAADGPRGSSSIVRVSGMMMSAPTNPESSGDNSSLPTRCAVCTRNRTTTNQRSDPLGALENSV
jgi:hypothetical protein